MWLSAVAQHTKTIRIGHGVRLLPFNYNHPVRASEMAAVLDIMSHGRLEFGTGRSALALELEGFGIDPEIVEHLGPEYVIWASDYPHLDASFHVVDTLRERIARLPDDARRKVLGTNALRFYGLAA